MPIHKAQSDLSTHKQGHHNYPMPERNHSSSPEIEIWNPEEYKSTQKRKDKPVFRKVSCRGFDPSASIKNFTQTSISSSKINGFNNQLPMKVIEESQFSLN
jgi:hypothetical protein